MLHNFEVITDYLKIFASHVCFKETSVAGPSQFSNYHQLLFAGLRGYPLPSGLSRHVGSGG